MDELKKYKKAWKLWEEWVKKEDVCNMTDQYQQIDFDGEYLDIGCDRPTGSHFVKLPYSMVYGILLEFLDEQGLLIDVSPDMPGNKDAFFFSMKIVDRMLNHLCIWEPFKTRLEAQLAAVEKAFEILEKRLEV